MMFPMINLYNGLDIWSDDNLTFPHGENMLEKL
jgi:hypothetical protein